jgi:hypothetical protein
VRSCSGGAVCPLRSKTCPEGCKVYAGSLLIPAAVGAYSENGPVGAAINPRRVRLTARRGSGFDASHPIRAQSPADRARIHRGSFWRHSFNGCRQDEDRGGMTDGDPEPSRTLLSMRALRWRALAEIRQQPGCSGVLNIAINHVTANL